jgi:hypothetical protein
MPSTPAPVAGALRLRDWALGVLCARGAAAGPPPLVSPEGWSLFLRTEQCALALAARAAGAADPTAAAALAAFTHAESRTVLSARAQLRRLGALASGRGLQVAVLKGGAPLLRGAEGPRLLDVDLLASRADAAALAAALDDAGYQAFGGAASHRLAVRAAPGDIPLEIHTAIPGISATEAVWARAQPAGDGRGLRVLHPADHLRYLLLHSVVQHADRRGRIRDLLLVADGIAQCTPEDVREVEDAVAQGPHARVLAAQLAMGRAVAAGEACADAFELTAAGTYLTQWRLARTRIRGVLMEMAWQAATAAVARRSGAPALVGEHGLELPSAVPALAALRRVAPGMERAARTLVRRSREWAFLPLGLAVASAAERAVRERHSSTS